jgi:hypothetical protein
MYHLPHTDTNSLAPASCETWVIAGGFRYEEVRSHWRMWGEIDSLTRAPPMISRLHHPSPSIAARRFGSMLSRRPCHRLVGFKPFATHAAASVPGSKARLQSRCGRNRRTSREYATQASIRSLRLQKLSHPKCFTWLCQCIFTWSKGQSVRLIFARTQAHLVCTQRLMPAS